MSVVNEKIPLKQVFTSPMVYNFVLNTDTKFRNNNLYILLLNKIDKRMLAIPWARTGRPYLDNNCKSDNYAKDYHAYGSWIKNELFDTIKGKIFNGNLDSLNIFNMTSISNLIEYNKKYGTDDINRVDELLVWLVSLSEMVEMYNIKTNSNKEETAMDKFNSAVVSKVYLFAYFNARKYFR